MAVLPQKLPWEMAQTRWANEINPIIDNPLNGASVLQNVSLVTGTNVINHKLGKPLQGWYTTRKRASSDIYDNQDSNQTPQLTLVLIASAPVVIDLAVF